jgi:ubiquinone/menaquinone biosynthesis C-methylase UbiE
MKFEDFSVASHQRACATDLASAERVRIANSWFDETTADFWRHNRAYQCAECLSEFSEASWLTIGDGRWGLDSVQIRKRGFRNILATDIGEALLKAAKDRGIITDYSVQNAEKLSFPDGAFDFVFCKESFHHFPRPYIALYEMLRVARRGVFLHEPNDTAIGAPEAVEITKQLMRGLFRDGAAGVLKKLRGRRAALARLRNRFSSSAPTENKGWEPSGNYVYTFSRFEAEKVAFGLNMPQLVFKGWNDLHIEGCEFEPADPEKSEIFRQILQTIEEEDQLCQEGVLSYGNISVGLLFEPLTLSARKKFEDCGWTVVDLPRNPYAGAENGLAK